MMYIGTINAQIAVPLNYLNNFWRTLEMPLINCEINLVLTCSANHVNSDGNRVTVFAITCVYKILNQVSKEQLTGINIDQILQVEAKTKI